MIKLSEMETQALKELYGKNEFLQKEGKRYAEDDFSINMNDMMGHFRKINGIEWNLGYPGDYINVDLCEYHSFFEACLKLGEDMPYIFSEETFDKIKRAEKKAEFYYASVIGYEEPSMNRFNMLEKWINDIVADAVREIIKSYHEEESYYYSDEAAEEAFFNWWMDCNGDNYLTDGEYVYEAELRKYS